MFRRTPEPINRVAAKALAAGQGVKKESRMARNHLVIELDEVAVNYLYRLMDDFGEDRPVDMIATALAALDAVKEFVDGRVLTVVDPRVVSDNDAHREVEIVFRKARPARAAVRELIEE